MPVRNREICDTTRGTSGSISASMRCDARSCSATRLDNPSLLFEMLSDRYAIGLRANGRRVRDADCVDPITNATLYEVPDAPSRPDDANIPVLFRVLLLAQDGQNVCVRLEGDAQRGWHLRSFTTDGHRLPQLDQTDQLITIVPAVVPRQYATQSAQNVGMRSIEALDPRNDCAEVDDVLEWRIRFLRVGGRRLHQVEKPPVLVKQRLIVGAEIRRRDAVFVGAAYSGRKRVGEVLICAHHVDAS